MIAIFLILHSLNFNIFPNILIFKKFWKVACNFLCSRQFLLTKDHLGRKDYKLVSKRNFSLIAVRSKRSNWRIQTKWNDLRRFNTSFTLGCWAGHVESNQNIQFLSPSRASFWWFQELGTTEWVISIVIHCLWQKCTCCKLAFSSHLLQSSKG